MFMYKEQLMYLLKDLEDEGFMTFLEFIEIEFCFETYMGNCGKNNAYYVTNVYKKYFDDIDFIKKAEELITEDFAKKMCLYNEKVLIKNGLPFRDQLYTMILAYLLKVDKKVLETISEKKHFSDCQEILCDYLEKQCCGIRYFVVINDIEYPVEVEYLQYQKNPPFKTAVFVDKENNKRYIENYEEISDLLQRFYKNQPDKAYSD